MATTITVDGTAIDFNDFSIEIPLSPEGVVPTAEIETNVNESVTAGDGVVIDDGGTTIFEGEADSGGTKERGGRLRVTATHDAIKLFEESVSLNVTGPPTGSEVLQAAVDASSVTADVTLSYPDGGAALSDDYVVEDRQILSIFRDMTDAASDVWWVDPAGDTITVEDPGNQGQWRTFDTTQDAALVRSFDTGSVDTVRNDVTVIGTGAEKVVGTDSDSTSISNYGTRSEVYNLSWVTSQFQADAISTELLIPDPLPEGELLVGTRAGGVTTPRVNQTVDVDDSAKSISETGLIIEKQTIEQQRTELAVGEGSGVSLENFNRQGRSRGDITEPGSVYENDRLSTDSVDTEQLVDTSVIEAKLDDLAVATAKLQDNAVINGKLDDLSVSETKIQDGSISTPKLVAEAVTAAKIEADTITASEIAAGTITALEIGSDEITANEIAAGTITALEIAADTLTANEIDTMDLDTNQLTVGANVDEGFEFGTESVGAQTVATLRAQNEAALIGEPTNHIDAYLGATEFDADITMAGFAPIIAPDGDNEGSLGTSGRSWGEVYADSYLDSSGSSITADGGDPLAGLATGAGPPDHAVKTDDDGERIGTDIGKLAHTVMDICREQQRRIEALEDRISQLKQNT